MKELGLQLYTIRDFMQTEEDIRESFRKMRQYGYTQAQTAGCKIPYADFGRIAKEEGIQIVGTHDNFDMMVNDFEQALENADLLARRVYREEAKQIEELRKGIIAVSNNEPPYDIFICYKETDETGSRTLDSVLAQDVYEALTDKGYRVFFSRITLEDKLGVEYEPYIFAALNSAKVMLAFGTDYEYFNAVWVKNEWSRYRSSWKRIRAST